jgi:hypothetical protein
MSPLDRPVPPAGEEIHIPGGSVQPLLLTLGITMSLLGVTIFTPVLLILGLVLTAAVLFVWIREARQEYEHLPLDHHATHTEAPRGE